MALILNFRLLVLIRLFHHALILFRVREARFVLMPHGDSLSEMRADERRSSSDKGVW